MSRQKPNNENNESVMKHAVAGILSAMASHSEPATGVLQRMHDRPRAGAALLTPTTLTSLEDSFAERNTSNHELLQRSLKRSYPSYAIESASQVPVNYVVESLSHPTESLGSDNECGFDDKKRIRRERNKVAAAKCRQKRVDLTNELQGQVNDLDTEATLLNEELRNLQQEKEQLEFVLQAHRPVCRISKVPTADRPMNLVVSSKKNYTSPKKTSPLRPNCLPVASSSHLTTHSATSGSKGNDPFILPLKKNFIRMRSKFNEIAMKREPDELHTPEIHERPSIAISTPSRSLSALDGSSSGFTPVADCHQLFPATPSGSSGLLRQRSSSSSAGSDLSSPVPTLLSL